MENILQRIARLLHDVLQPVRLHAFHRIDGEGFHLLSGWCLAEAHFIDNLVYKMFRKASYSTIRGVDFQIPELEPCFEMLNLTWLFVLVI